MKLPNIKFKLDESDILPLCFIALSVTQVGLFFCLAILSGSSALNPGFILVQQADGSSFIGEPKPLEYRGEKVIQTFVETWVRYQFTWSGLISSNGETTRDKGVPLNEEQKIPTAAAEAAFALPDSLQLPFLQGLLQQKWIPDDYFSQNPTTTVINIDFLGTPLVLDSSKGTYSVKVKATLNYHNKNQTLGKVSYWEKEIIVASIPVPKVKPGASSSVYERLSYRWDSLGLQIKEINPLKL